MGFQSRPITYVSIVCTLLIVVLSTIVVALTLTYKHRVTATGTVKGIGIAVYKDADGTEELHSINWGEIPVGGFAETTIYVKNTGNSPVTLTLSTENWNPELASQVLTLTWNYTSTPIDVSKIIPIKLTLQVASDPRGLKDFTFDIIITATG